VLAEPYEVVAPYMTCESAALLVVQVIVAPVAVIDEAVIPERVSGPNSESVDVLDELFNVAVIALL
jgi:hypothetical protein